MNKFKIIAILFAITSILSLTNIKAVRNYEGLANITIPAKSGAYVSDSVSKLYDGSQYATNFGAIDQLSSDHRALEGRIYGANLKYVNLKEDTEVELACGSASNEYGCMPSSINKLQVKATKWTLTTATAYIMWVIDK